MSAEGSNNTGKVSAGCLDIRVYLMKTTHFHRSLRGQGFAEGCRNGICRCTPSQGRSMSYADDGLRGIMRESIDLTLSAANSE